MCLRSVFLLATRAASWLRLSRREEAWKIAEILVLRHQFAVCNGSSRAAARGSTGPTRATARTRGTYLAAHHAQVRGRRGSAKAIGATRHDILVAYWHIVHDRVPFRELGPDWPAHRYSVQYRTNRLVRQLEALGVKVTIDPATT